MRTKLISFLILIELVMIVFLIFKLNQKQKGVLGTISVNPIQKEYLILRETKTLKYFYEPKPSSVQTIDLSWIGSDFNYKVQYKINSDGLNQINNYSVEKPSDVYRIVTLGDSFTFGQNVNTQENYPSILQKLLDKNCTRNKFQVLNLGVYGYDIQYTKERYILRGQKYDPDLILWFVIEDDLKRINELLIPREGYYKKHIEGVGNYYEEVVKYGDYYPAWVRARDEIVNELGGEDNILKLQKEYLKELNHYYNGRLVLFTFPFTEDKYKNILKEFVHSRPGIFYYDEIPTLSEKDGELLPDSHPSLKGHKKIAQNLFDYLTENKIIPCN